MINKLIEAQFKKNSKMCYTLDIDEIRAIVKDIGSRVSNPITQFENINNSLEKNYGVKLPYGLNQVSIEKFGDVASSPLIIERAINSIMKKIIVEGETKIVLKNPKALYRIGILGFEDTVKLDLIVEGNVGNFFGAFCNFDGTWIVDGNAENGLADKGYKGKIIINGFATELACQNNQTTNFSGGVNVLIKKGCMERAMGQARGGKLVTFGAGYNSGLYMSGGVLLNLGLPGEMFGPGMVGGIIYSPEGTTTAEGAVIAKLTLEDYSIIKETLRVFENELFIEGLDNFSMENPTLSLTNNINKNIQKFNMHDFIKIVPKTTN
jgi:glutamate synthase domain-containing protein 3